MWCNEKKDVYNLLESKGVDLEGIQMPNSTGCIKNYIPWHDRNDSGAAGVVGLGQIDGIDMSGENNPMYGRSHSKDTRIKMSYASNFKEKRRWCVSPEGKTTTIPVSEPLPERYQWGRFYDPYKPDPVTLGEE